MYKPDGQDVVTVMPTPGAPGAVNGWYTPGDPSTGAPASVVDPHWHNMLAAELLAILTAAGITPDQNKANYTQVLQSLNKLYTSGLPPVSSTTGGGTAGIDYTVASWEDPVMTLNDGQIYTFKVHTANQDACHVDHNGNQVNIKMFDGSDPPANAMVAQGVYYFHMNNGQLQIINPTQTRKIANIMSDGNLAPTGPAVVNKWYRVAASQSIQLGRGAREILITNFGNTAPGYMRLLWYSADANQSSIQLLNNDNVSGNVQAVRVCINASSQTSYLDIQASTAFTSTLRVFVLNDGTFGATVFTKNIGFTDVTSLPVGDTVACTLNLRVNNISIIQGYAYSGHDDQFMVTRDGAIYNRAPSTADHKPLTFLDSSGNEVGSLSIRGMDGLGAGLLQFTGFDYFSFLLSGVKVGLPTGDIPPEGTLNAQALQVNGVPAVAGELSSSGNRWNVFSPINGAGIMETGKFLDFHETDGDTKDYDGRLSVESGVLRYVPNAGATSDVILLSHAASQAEQEAGSATNKFVTPGRQHYHPSAAKVWGRASYNVSGVPTLDVDSYGVSSVTDVGTGDIRFNYSASLSNIGNSVLPAALDIGNHVFTTLQSQNNTQCEIKIYNDAGTAIDPDEVCFATFGDRS